MIKFLPVPKKYEKYEQLIADIKNICRKYEVWLGLESWSLDVDWGKLEDGVAEVTVSPEYYVASLKFDPKAISEASGSTDSHVRHEFIHILNWPMREFAITIAKTEQVKELARKTEERVTSDWERAPFWSRL